MLPMPEGVENIYHAEAKLKERWHTIVYNCWHVTYIFKSFIFTYENSDSEDVDLHLKTNIEGAIIKWAQQIHDLLQEDSYIGMKIEYVF